MCNSLFTCTFKTTVFSEPIQPSFQDLFSYEVFSRIVCVFFLFSVRVPRHSLFIILDSFVATLT